MLIYAATSAPETNGDPLMPTYYINGSFVDADTAVIPANDLAVLRGYGAFDFLRTYGSSGRLLDYRNLRFIALNQSQPV